MRKTTLSPAYFFSPANINIMKSERKLQRKARVQGAAQTHPRRVDDKRDADDLDRLGKYETTVRTPEKTVTKKIHLSKELSRIRRIDLSEN